MAKIFVPALDKLLGATIPVLDDGFIRVIDYMGSDDSIVQAARVSYGEGTKKVREDRGLIRYLMRHRHTTPFEMCVIKFHVRVPMDCWRQWIRHRTASINEYSTRYSIAIDATQKTEESAWRRQSQSNRQGASDYISTKIGKTLTESERRLHTHCREVYVERLSQGVAREQARKDLPLSTYTEAYWAIDLHNLFHFLELRMAGNAQREIRQYAITIAEKIVSIWCPLAWEAFSDFRSESMELSCSEVSLIRAIENGQVDQALRLCAKLGWISKDGKLKANRERQETEDKLSRLGLDIPWGS